MIKIEIKIVIAGSRNYDNYEEARAYIDICLKDIRQNNTPVIISGGCRGADMIGVRYAKDNGFDIIEYPAE